MKAGTILLMLTMALGVCLGLSACTPFAGVVSDAWPTWAGGMPKDVPPRPGAPGYEEFMAHQSHQDVAPNAAPNTAAAPGTTAAVAPTGAAPGTTAVAVPVGAVPVATAPGATAAVPPPAGRYTQPAAAGAAASSLRPPGRSKRDPGWVVLDGAVAESKATKQSTHVHNRIRIASALRLTALGFSQ